MKTLSISSLLIRVIAVILAMGVHEAAHGLVSYCFGDPTALNRGRLTLNPLAHIDWLGLLCLLVFGFGWARPVPVDSSYYKNRNDLDFLCRTNGELFIVFSLCAFVLCLFPLSYSGTFFIELFK